MISCNRIFCMHAVISGRMTIHARTSRNAPSSVDLLQGSIQMRFTIKAKLAIAFGLLIAVTLCCAGFGMRGVSLVASMQDELLTGPVRQDGYASNLARAFDSLNLAESDL